MTMAIKTVRNLVGVFCFIFRLFFVGYAIGAQIETAVLHLDGTPVEEQIGRSQPFLFQVSADVSESFNVPTLAMPPQTRSQLISTNVITNGGKARARYQFQIQIDALGTFRIGPATLKTSHGELVSDSVYVEVVDAPTGSNPGVHTIPHKAQGPFARLFTEKDDYFVGERIEAKLRFYYRENFLECEELRDPDYDKKSGITIGKARGPVFGSEKIDGVTYKFYEWTFDCYCHTAGRQLLRPYRIDYSTTSSSLFAFMGYQPRAGKSTYSNEVHLEIHNVPPSSGKVDAVGRFDSYTARINPAVVHQGEATTIRLELVGDPVDLSDISIKGLDASLKLYPPTQTAEKRSGRRVHIFEYVLQPKKVGDFIIPAQQFTFFDPEAKKYRTLSTQELSLSVIESGSHATAANVDPVKTVEPISVVALDNRSQNRSPAPIGSALFFALMGLLVGISALLTVIQKQLCSFTFFKRISGRYQARQWAKQGIRTAYKQKQYHRLHGIVYEYAARIARMYQVNSEGLLKKIGAHMPSSLYDRYATFLTTLEQATFSQKGSNDILSAREIISWLPTIDRGVRRESK